MFDLETDGLLDEVTVVHLLVIKDLETRVSYVFRDHAEPLFVFKNPGRPIAEGLAILERAELVYGHNITGYDCPVLEKLYGLVIPWHRQRDTLVLARLLWPEQKKIDAEARKAKRAWALNLPGQLTGSGQLEAWGYRLGMHKGDYQGDSRLVSAAIAEWGPNSPIVEEARKRMKAEKWAAWNPDMEAYGIQDVEVTAKLLDRCIKELDTWARPDKGETNAMFLPSVLIETQVASIICRQERHGFLFDQAAAVKLYALLVQRRLELELTVKAVFKPMFLRDGSPKQAQMIPKRDNKAAGYCAGAELTKVKLTEFNPGSRDHVAYWLTANYGWKPTEFTSDGKPKIDDDVVSALPYAEAAPLKEYFLVTKRIAAVAEGGEAWLKRVKKDGRMHGRVNPNGAVTGRMTHMTPNMGQVPANRSPYGIECRALFTVPADKTLVGIDADALELRDLAGYMAIYDGGEYIRTVLEGNKSLGTDMHSVNCRALGMDPVATQWNGQAGRDIAKTWFYAFVYGSGDENLGYVQSGSRGAQAKLKGAAGRAAFLKNLPAMGKLVEMVRSRAKTRGYLLGLDGRHLSVRSQHAALNTLLQAAGAIQMKKALCLLDESLQAIGLVPSIDYEFVANVHDEWQLEVSHEHAESVGAMGCEAIRAAGDFFAFRCPLAGNSVTGRNWAATH